MSKEVRDDALSVGIILESFQGDGIEGDTTFANLSAHTGSSTRIGKCSNYRAIFGSGGQRIGFFDDIMVGIDSIGITHGFAATSETDIDLATSSA